MDREKSRIHSLRHVTGYGVRGAGYAFRGADLARPSVRPRYHSTPFDFEDEDDDDL